MPMTGSTMARKLERVGYVLPASTRRDVRDPLLVEPRDAHPLVVWEGLFLPTVVRGRQAVPSIGNCPPRYRVVSWARQGEVRNALSIPCHDDRANTVLRDPVVGRVDKFRQMIVSSGVQQRPNNPHLGTPTGT
jgi:hypothetical protein